MSGHIKLFPTKFPGYYVSRSGKVYREPNKYSDKRTGGPLVEVGQSPRGGNPKNGRYMSVNISLKENGKTIKQLKYYTHRLIAETLIPNPQNLTEVNHKDEDKLNNSVDNLEWISHKDNLEYSGVDIKYYNEQRWK